MAYTDYLDAVQKMYIGYYQRPADSLGLIYWAAKLDAAGGNKVQIIEAFSTSAEAGALYGTIDSTNIETVVDSIYTALFGRVADSAGKAYYVDGFNAGTFTPGTIVLNILDGATGEDKLSVDNKVTASNLFTETIDPNLDGRNFQATYSGDTDAAAARTWLADVGWNPVTVPIQSEVTAFLQTSIADASDPILTVTSGETFTLTAGTNNFVGTSGDDTFDGALTSTGAITLNASDALDGGAGTDTLAATFNAAGTYQASSIKNIEDISIIFTTAASTMSLSTATGYTSLEAQGSTVDAAFSGINSTAVGLKVSNTTTDATFGYVASALTGTADAVTVTVSNVNQAVGDGIEFTAGIETLNIVSTGNTNVVDEIDSLVTDTITKIVVTGDQKLTVTDNLESSVVTFDASAATGAVDVDFGAGAPTVTGGAGNDSFSFEAAGAVSAVGGAGNDTFTFDAVGTLTSADTVTGGDGTDTVTSTAAEAEAITSSLTKMTGIEVIKLSDAGTAAATLGAAYFGADVKTATLNAGTAGAYTVTMNAGDNTLKLGASLGGALTINDTGTAITDTLTIVNSATVADDMGDANNLVIGGFETVTINTTNTGATESQDFGTIAITPDTNGTGTLKITGTNKLTTTGAITAKVIDASGMTAQSSGSTFVMGAAAASGLSSITGSAGNDTLIGDASSYIDGGAGRDGITGGSGNDTLIGGDGNDTITSGAGNDNISGGAGNDTLTLAGDLATGDVIDGGDGTDTLSVSNASLTTLNAYAISAITNLNGNISNVERLTISDDLDQTSFDVARLDSINYITVTDWAGAESLIGLAPATTIKLDDSGGGTSGTDDLTLAYADATGSADALTIALVNDTAASDFGDVTIADIESLTITTAEATATTTAEVFTFDLTASGLTTLTVTGTESLDMDAIAVNATTVDLSGVADSSALTAPYVNFLGGSASQAITGSAGADSINGGSGTDTISGGEGADALLGGTGADSITGGDGADTITGGAGNDAIILTEANAAVDDVVLDYSEAGAYVDTVTGFTTTSTGDEIQLDLSALETAGTSGIDTAATNFQALDANTDAAVGAGTVQLMTAAAAAAGAANIFVLRGATLADVSEVEDALETGGAFALTISTTDADVVANDAFIVVYTDGVNAYVASARVNTDAGTAGVFAAGALDVNNLATLVGVTSIGSTTFASANFEWIA